MPDWQPSRSFSRRVLRFWPISGTPFVQLDWMEKRRGNSNAHTLFGMEQIPTDTHIRNLLDPVAPEPLFVPFRQAFRELEQAEILKRFRVKNGKSSHLLLVFDGTEHFSSEKLGCKNCTKRKLKKKTRYPVKLDER